MAVFLADLGPMVFTAMDEIWDAPQCSGRSICQGKLRREMIPKLFSATKDVLETPRHRASCDLYPKSANHGIVLQHFPPSQYLKK